MVSVAWINLISPVAIFAAGLAIIAVMVSWALWKDKQHWKKFKDDMKRIEDEHIRHKWGVE